jgi:hypothetical protein
MDGQSNTNQPNMNNSDTNDNQSQIAGRYPPSGGNQAGNVWPTENIPQVAGVPAGQQPAIQDIQPAAVSPSPEAPARIEHGESLQYPEVAVEEEKRVERAEKKEMESKTERIEAPIEAPDQKKFESPFKVYGYKITQKLVDLSKKISGIKVKGDVNSSKTWLLVLLGRILRMYKGGELGTS